MRTVSLTIFLLFSSARLFAQTADDNIIELLKSKYSLTNHDRPERIIRFNRDTILIAGYLEDLSSEIPRYKQNTNVVYKTTDGGKNWKVVKFDGNAWVYTSTCFPNGKIWMGGSDNFIHYSSDYGETWTKFAPPFNPINRVLSLYMVDENFGISGGLSNGLAITYDNWKNTIQIPTPIDQDKFKILSNSSRNRIDKVGIIDSLILINQNDYIFYSELYPISWKEFKIPVSNFSIDKEKKIINLSSRDNKHFIIDSKLQLIEKYSSEDEYTFTIPKSENLSELNSFFNTPIKTISILSKTYEFDKQVHMMALFKEKTQTATISFKNNKYIFKSKGFKKQAIYFDMEKFEKIILLENSQNINKVKNYFRFEKNDLEQYQKYLTTQSVEFQEREKWGGNPTSMIKPSDVSKYNENDILQVIKPINLERIFIENYFPPLFETEKNNIEIVFYNSTNEEMKISNYNSIFFSLPWTITYRNKNYYSYNPDITYFLREIIPSNFSNYNMLLSGNMIYKIFEQDLINRIEY